MSSALKRNRTADLRRLSISTDRQIVPIEKFPVSDLSGLREDLLQSGLDSRHVAELIRSFLAERGYGVSHDDARSAATNVAVLHGPIQQMQETLERVAVSM